MSDHITPRQARELLDGTTPGPWAVIQDPPYVSIVRADDIYEDASPVIDIPDAGENGPQPDHTLAAAAPDMARMIAGARVEYCEVEFNGSWFPSSDWTTTKPDSPMIATRLVIDLEEEA